MADASEKPDRTDTPKSAPLTAADVKIVNVTKEAAGTAIIFTGMVMPKPQPASGGGAEPMDKEPVQNS